MPLYPVEWLRKEWRRTLTPRAHDSEFIAHTHSDEETRDIQCPGCGADAPTAPIRSRYHEPDRVEHDWRCGCATEWTTSTKVPK